MEWHARYHRDALDGMRVLTLEERGAYQTILDLIYDYGRPIADDPRWLAGWLGVSVRKWSGIRDALVLKGKISINDGFISNFRAVLEIEKAVKHSRNLREAGARGGNKSAEKRAKPLENNEAEQSPAATVAASEPEASLKLGTGTVHRQDNRPSPLRARAIHDVDLWKARLADATARAGKTLRGTDPSCRTYTVLRNLCEPASGEPCDWDADVVPAIDIIASRGRVFDNWNYIERAAIQNRDRRLAGLPAPQAVSDQPRRTGKPDAGAAIDRVFGAAS